MRHSLQAIVWITALACGFAAGSAGAWAQAKKPDAKNIDPKKPQGDGQQPKVADPLEKLKVPPPLDPIVKELLGSYSVDKSTPDELMQAIKLLLDLKHPAEAKPYVAKLAGAMLDDEQLMKLGRKYGTGEFSRLSFTPQLAPEGKTIADKVLAATRRLSRDPMRLAGLAERLKSAVADERTAATAELSYGGDAAVNILLAILADTARAAEHENVRTALVNLGGHAREPLLGSLDTPDVALRVQMLDVLLRLNAHDALIQLLAPAVNPQADRNWQTASQTAVKSWLGRQPTREQVVATLARHARYYYGGGTPKPADLDGLVPLWRWDAPAKRAVLTNYRAEDAALILAARLAEDWLALDPKSDEARRIVLASSLQTAAYQNGLGKALPAGAGTARDRAASFGAPAVEDLMRHALETGRWPAAAAAARLLGEIGKEDLLRSVGGKPSPLVAAVSHPDARVRFAALESVIKLKPKQAFLGSHTIPEALAFFSGTSGALRALVADVSPQEAQRMAGLLSEIGYEGEIAIGAKSMLRSAAASPDTAMVLFNTSLPYADADTLLQELRQNPRAGALPVGFISLGSDTQRIERLTQKYPRTALFVRTRNPQDMQLLVNRLMATVGRDFLTLDERQQHAKQALIWMTQLAAAQATSPQESLYDFKPHERTIEPALFVPALSAQAAEVLGHLATPFAQRTLVNVASADRLPIEARQAAAAAFSRAVSRLGLQLTKDEIRQQYDRYNASSRSPAETQQVLGTVLDAIESLRKKKQGM